MPTLKHNMKRFLDSDAGPTTTEYAVMLAVIAVAVISSLALFGDHMNNVYVALSNTLEVF